MKLIGDRRTWNKIEHASPDLIKRLNESEVKSEIKEKPGIYVPSGNFSIEANDSFYRLNGVSYRENNISVDVSKTLLPNGTQDEHAARRIEALKNGEFYLPDFPLFHAIFNSLYQNRDGGFKDSVEEARKNLSELIDGKWLMTLSRIRYDPKGNDLVIHNYKQSNAYEVSTKFVGPDGWIKESKTNAGNALQVLLGTKQSINEVNDVYNWFRDKDCYIWRLNSKPENVDERVARFGADSGRSGFNCNGNPRGSSSGLGVRENFLD